MARRKSSLVSLLSIFWRLPGGELAQLLETLFFELEKLAVVFFVDCLNARSALARRSMTLGLGWPAHPVRRVGPTRGRLRHGECETRGQNEAQRSDPV